MYPYPLDPRGREPPLQLDEKTLKEIEELLNQPITDKPFDNWICLENFVMNFLMI